MKCQSEKCSEPWRHVHSANECNQEEKSPSKTTPGSSETCLDSSDHSLGVVSDARIAHSEPIENNPVPKNSADPWRTPTPPRETSQDPWKTPSQNPTNEAGGFVQGSDISPIKVIHSTGHVQKIDVQIGQRIDSPSMISAEISLPGSDSPACPKPQGSVTSQFAMHQTQPASGHVPNAGGTQQIQGTHIQGTQMQGMHIQGTQIQGSQVQNSQIQATQVPGFTQQMQQPAHFWTQQLYWQKQYLVTQQQTQQMQVQSNPSYYPNLTIQPCAMARPPIPAQTSHFQNPPPAFQNPVPNIHPSPAQAQPVVQANTKDTYLVAQQMAYNSIQGQKIMYPNPQVNTGVYQNTLQNNPVPGQGTALSSAAQVANSIAFHYSHPQANYNPYQPR